MQGASAAISHGCKDAVSLEQMVRYLSVKVSHRLRGNGPESLE